jgi:hypothetical protein
MNLDLFLVQKVIQSLLKHEMNTTLTPLDAPLSSSLKSKQKMKEDGNERVKMDHAMEEMEEMEEIEEMEEEMEQVENKMKEKQNRRKLLEVYSMFYDKMNAANVYVNTQKNSGCFEYQETAVDIDSQIPRPKSFLKTYITPEILQYITNESKRILTFECKIKGRLIRLHFIIFKNNPNGNDLISHYKVLAHRVYMWLSMISDKSKCVETLNMYIYLTPFEKKIPATKGQCIGPENANTGYTFRCEKHNEIIIYRQEEWFKVLIHETMHAFGVDFDDSDDLEGITKADEYLKTLFTLPDDVNIKLSETYSEIWARIMNVVFQTYFKSPPSLESQTLYKFKKNIDFYLHLECVFSLYQCIKILDYMGINYAVLTDNSESSKQMVTSFYRENTNVFAYYVLTSILLNNYRDFLPWCANHNGAGLNIFKMKTTKSEFVNLIKLCYKKSDLLKQIVDAEKKVVGDYKKASTNRVLLKTMRMTIVGFD